MNNQNKNYSRNNTQQHNNGEMGRNSRNSRFSSEDHDQRSHDNSSNYASESSRENRGRYGNEGHLRDDKAQDRYSPDHMQNNLYGGSDAMMNSQSQSNYGQGQYDQNRNLDYGSAYSTYPSTDFDRSRNSSSNYSTRGQDFTERQFRDDRSMGQQSNQYGQRQQYGQQYGNQHYGSYGQTSGQTSGQMTGRGPKGYRRSDERMREDVCDALAHHGGIDASEVEVKVSEGIVTLSGTVNSRQMKRMIEDASDSISGVQDVKNEIKVQSSMNRTENQDSSSSSLSSGDRASHAGKGSSTQGEKPGKH